jgi:hypothetical protein
MWSGFIYLRIRAVAGSSQHSTFGFHKWRGFSWLDKKLLAFQEGLGSMELIGAYEVQALLSAME